MKIKVFSVFSGVGGFEQGLDDRFEVIGFSEIDKYANQVLKYHYPNIPNYGDITKINWNDIPDFDLLTGGSPCQDLSIAGKRRGLAGARSGLFMEYIRILHHKKPKYFIWENVKGALSSNYGFDFAVVLNEFSEAGYNLWWQVLNAKDFGVPQNRERIFVVGFREECPQEVFFEREDNEKFNEAEWDISSDEAKRHGGGSSDTNSKNGEDGEGGQLHILNRGASQHYRVYGEKGLAPTLQSQSGMSSQKHPFIVAQRGRNPQNPKSRKSGLATEQMLEPNLEGVANTLTSVEKDNYVMEIANCLTPDAYLAKGERKRDENGKAVLTSMHERRIRKLMPVECERLMGWADDWTKWGRLNDCSRCDGKGKIYEASNGTQPQECPNCKIEISDSQRYKMCGNGVVSNVVKEIVKNLI